MSESKKKEFFLNNGLTYCGNFLSSQAKRLYEEAYNIIDFKNLFLSREEFETQDTSLPSDPIPGRNLAEKLQPSFFFENPEIRKTFKSYCGSESRILDYKFVAGVPRSIMPTWVQELTTNVSNYNLTRLIRPCFRNCTYFSGLDLHQDIIDYPKRNPDFLTFYYYLSPVNYNDSPLIALSKSHQVGVDKFPHDLTLDNSQGMKFLLNDTVMYPYMLSGEPGDLFAWHPYILHGTYPIDEGIPRISLRILIERNAAMPTDGLISKLNENIHKITPALTTVDNTKLKRKSILRSKKSLIIKYFQDNKISLQNDTL